MAITNAQQAKQLLSQGGRIGFQGGGKDSSTIGTDNFKAREYSPSEKRDQQKTAELNQRIGGGGDGESKEPPSVISKPPKTKTKTKDKSTKKKKNIFKSIFDSRKKGIYNIVPNNPKRELEFLSSLRITDPAKYNSLPQNLKDLLDDTRIGLDKIADDGSFKDAPKFSYEDFKSLTEFDDGAFAKYAAERGSPGLSVAGDMSQIGDKFVKRDPITGDPLKDMFGNTLFDYAPVREGGGGDGIMSDYERRLLELENQLKNQQAQAAETSAAGTSPFYRIMADGGMTNDAPMMQGGITDLALRDEFFLGGVVKGIKKGIKGVTRAVKKVAKSPIGKAALLAAPFAFNPGAIGSFFGKGSFNPFLRKVAGDTAFSSLGSILNKIGAVNAAGKLTTGGIITALTATPFIGELLGLNEQKEDEELYAGPGVDFNAQPFYRLAADGGLMRQQYQEGSKEPVAKKTMPLIDMGGKEKDYRETGGFVDMGRMEKADDVPARLSKNEFVFTAEAVRNAGDGNVDKGSEVMYNMMKNLESGGDVSEESQGLDGAREMFQTSKRLEEVI